MATDVLIVRHGQSTWNALGRWQGHADPPLSRLGLRQSVAAGDALDCRFDHYLASDLDRAFETARTIATAHEEAVVSPDRAFRERCAGEWEGLTRAQIDDRWPDWELSLWRPDGFETDVDLLKRVLPAMDQLVETMTSADATTALVVSHGGVIRALDRHFDTDIRAIPNLAGRWFRHDGAWSPGDFVELASDITDSDLE